MVFSKIFSTVFIISLIFSGHVAYLAEPADDCMVSIPDAPDGTTSGRPNTSYIYSTGGAECSNGHDVRYVFCWGDGTRSQIMLSTFQAKSWEAGDEPYEVRVQAVCDEDFSIRSDWSSALSVTISHSACAVSVLEPVGPNSGTAGTMYFYSAMGGCLNGHSVQYRFDWDDGSCSSWSSSQTAGNSWPAREDPYMVKAQARCSENIGAISNWSLSKPVMISDPPCSVSTPRAPSGQDSVAADTEYLYSTWGAECSKGHDVEYRFDWGDESYSDWLSASWARNSWPAREDPYEVRAQARCSVETGSKSGWSAASNVTVSGPPFAGGDGSENDPFQVTTIEALDGVRLYLSAHYILMNDLDFEDEGSYADPGNMGYYLTGPGWSPIGGGGSGFAGKFHGGGHTISGLFINAGPFDRVGLFGYVSAGGAIKEIGLEGVEISGGMRVGGLAGKNEGSVSNTYATGTVTGWRYAGGLVGENAGSVSKSYAAVYVAGDMDTGGFAGASTGTIALSFWDVDGDGLATGSGDENHGASGKTAAEMKDIATFIGAGWSIQENDINLNGGYPYLSGGPGDSHVWYIYAGDDPGPSPRRPPPASPGAAAEHPAPPGGFTVEPVDGFIPSNHITWRESGPVSSYRLYVSTGGSSGALSENSAEHFEFRVLGEFAPDTFEHTHTGLSRVRYYYVITSVDGEGLESNVTSPVRWANPGTGEYGELDAISWGPSRIIKEPDDGDHPSSCFIATAAYGRNAPETMSLRRFRDDHLAGSRTGRACARAYYMISPGIAGVFEGSSLREFILRAHLAPFVKLTRLTLN